MTWTRAEAEEWLREDRLREGQQWYLVAMEWWIATFTDPQSAAELDGDVPMEEASEVTTQESTESSRMGPVRNEALVDLEFSSKARKSVVLKPLLAEQRDYLVVSERVWNRLSHEFGFDWEIAREVIMMPESNKCIVKIYPVAFQLLYWRNGMQEPQEVVEGEANQPVVLVMSETESLNAVQHVIQQSLLQRLNEFFPDVKPEDVAKALQVAYRRTEQLPWVALQEALHIERNDTTKQIMVESTVVRDLDLEERAYRSGKERFHSLLIEGRFQSPEGTTDWRHDRFFSDILANMWRTELKKGQLIDALDTDKKWYESRVLDISEGKVFVHYRGWTDKWNEWIDLFSNRLAPRFSNVPNWRDFQVNDQVQVGRTQEGRAFPEWRNAFVREVEGNFEEGTLRIKVVWDGKEEWRDAQDELLCRPGTHKVTNASVSRPLGTAYSSNTPSYNRYSDRRDYSMDYGRGKPQFTGVVGLQNLGNTCFMNSMLQCLINAKPLKEYFLTNTAEGAPLFEKDVNEDNPLGMKGMIAREFAKLIKRMWGGEYTVVSPTTLKAVIGQYAPQFAGYQQQDSQEVMNFILDGLHEDLNRVRKKPYTTPVERNGRSDIEFAQEAWAQYLLRNDSVIVENFMGQLRSHVTCSNPDCANESDTFDPFMSLSVPIPADESVSVKVQLFWASGKIPTKYAVRVSKDATIGDVKEKLSALASIPASHLFFVEVRLHKIKKAHSDRSLIENIADDILHVYELEFPVSEYEMGSSNLRFIQPKPLAAQDATSNGKSMRLVALLHQAPVASPVDTRSEDYDFMDDANSGPKQRRVEVELSNTPLLVSVGTSVSKAEIHKSVWQAVRRLVSDETSFDCGEEAALPYRLHITQQNGSSALQRDVPYADEPADLPETSSQDYCFTLEWSRQGYQRGYDEKSAKRIELHESMRQLKITQPENVTLLNCLSKFTEREQLGKTDTWYCPKCKDHVRAFKKFDLFTLPRVLIFQLKRFRYAQSSFYMHRDKISTLVTFPIELLDLSEYVVGPKPDGGLIYDLFAVSEHSGGLGGGHYTAVAKNPDLGKWFSFNDSFTKEANPEDAITSRAYVLFYLRRE
ncbi:hypothetical protein Poli38472_012715 [Pythium oligandrum]|uniref:Ubiquitinyl hydrolase 1 n=1 Tax=Pythium oligandrum TaxID=41045 RepID=A0A8K1CDP4_PYTOL|nr:hypothetical protein Poli38472_012715 [Pythium oligandrum]|eukprot:TMW61524.1 hypothetical protein Poli38472_012715 [Pythium oligandrum]